VPSLPTSFAAPQRRRQIKIEEAIQASVATPSVMAVGPPIVGP